MSYFVYYDHGSCNDGSHSCRLETYQTLDECKKAIEGQEPYLVREDGFACIIHGEVSHQWVKDRLVEVSE